jgi:hypothetical protein
VSDPAPTRLAAPAESSFDWTVVSMHALVPLVVAWQFTALLGEEWSVTLFAAFVPLLGIGLRPAVWGIASGMRSQDPPRRRAYLERRDNAANVSLVTMAGTGLAVMDVFKLPGAPYWLNQPNAGLVLAAVAVYLIWLATHARIPAEVKAGWKDLLGPKGHD